MSIGMRVASTVVITVMTMVAIGFLYQQIGISGVGTAIWLLLFGAALRELGGER